MRKTSAFSLVELLVVIAIISILASIVGISFNYLTPKKLEMQARKLTGDLAWVRQRAVTENDNFFVYFTGKSYSIKKNTLSQFPIEDKTLDVDSLFCSSVTPNEIQFMPNGTALNSANITLGFRGQFANITVMNETGFVKWQ